MKKLQSDIKILNQINFLRIAALLGAAILFFACENDLEKIKPFTSTENLPVLYAENFESTSIDSGKIQFFLSAPVFQQFESEDQNFIEFPEGIKLITYDQNNNIISSITADYAKQFEKEQKWEAKNNVVATNELGDTLLTDYLVWEEKKERIYSENYVKIIRKDQIFTGIGFESDQNLDNWIIKDPKGTIYINVESSEKIDTLKNDIINTP